MTTRKRLAFITVGMVLLAIIFVSFGGVGGISKVLAQNYAGNPVAGPITGCPLIFSPPPTVRAITVQTSVFYAPDTNAVIGGLTLVPGSKWPVVGPDPTGKFQEILISCVEAWVPSGALG